MFRVLRHVAALPMLAVKGSSNWVAYCSKKLVPAQIVLIRKLSAMMRSSSWTSSCPRTQFTCCNHRVLGSVEYLAVMNGRLSSLHTKSFDEVFVLPPNSAQRIAGNVHKIYQEENAIAKVIDHARRFHKKEGRRPRILVVKAMDADQSSKVLASGLADMGFDVDVGPPFITPNEVAQQAVDADVHVVGVSSLDVSNVTLVSQLIDALRSSGRPDILVVVEGAIPSENRELVYKAGAAAIFEPGTPVSETASRVIDLLYKISASNL